LKSDATLSIELELKNTARRLHPAHIHFNTAAGAEISLTLKAVDGATGKVQTTFKTLDNGTAITSATWFDGYINVHLSADKLALLLRKATKRPYRRI
jgi:large exoprotein involved in heme utilization and adhesion